MTDDPAAEKQVNLKKVYDLIDRARDYAPDILRADDANQAHRCLDIVRDSLEEAMELLGHPGWVPAPNGGLGMVRASAST